MMKQLTLALALFGSVSACSKAKDDGVGTSAHSTKEAKPVEPPPSAAKPLTADFFGKAIAPPGQLGKLTFGKPMAEMLEVAGWKSSAVRQASDIEGVKYGLTEDTAGTFTNSWLFMKTSAKALIEQAWGPGKKVTVAGSDTLVWFNPETEIRVTYHEDAGESALGFRHYLPIAKLLGEGKQIAALSKPLLGHSPEEIKANYGALADERGRVSLPPTEWEFGSGITVSPYPVEGKSKSVAFSVPFRDREEKDAIYAAIKAKWGKPKNELKFAPGTWVYNDKDPYIEVSEDPNGITIRMGAAH